MVGGVLQGAPLAAGLLVIEAGHLGQVDYGLFDRAEAGAGGQDIAPVFGLALIDPHQGVLGRDVEVRDIFV